MLHTHVPEEYGGAGLNSFEGCLIAEELAVACGGVRCYLGGNGLGLMPLLIAGTPELKKELLPKHCAGPNLSAFCLTEAEAGSDAGAMRTTAKRVGNEYIISGTKQFITNEGVANPYSVFASEQPELRNKGISCFIVPAQTPGILAALIKSNDWSSRMNYYDR